MNIINNIITILVILINLKYLRSVDQLRKDIAREYHSSGLSHATEGDYIKAVAYFRGAVRLDNESYLYWNDLGVTEMRLGQLHKAKHRFIKSISLNNNFSTSVDNLNEIKNYFNKSEFEKGLKLSNKQLHKISNVDTIYLSDLTGENSQMILLKPFTIKNFSNILGWNTSVFQIESLIKNYGETRVDFYPHNMKEEQVYPFFTNLKNAVRQLFTFPEEIYEGVDFSEQGTYIQWNLNTDDFENLFSLANVTLPIQFNDDIWMNDCFESKDIRNLYSLNTHWRMLLIGDYMSGMFNHKDTLRTSSWQVQLLGHKKWHLCSPIDDRKLYQAGDIDAFQPDYRYYPKFRNVKTCFQVIVEPGDLIYYPKDYWHQTLNLDTPTVALSGTVITFDNYEYVYEELLKECNGLGRIFVRDEQLCNAINKCHQRWKDMFANVKVSQNEL